VNQEDLRRAIKENQPFQPLRIHLSNGRNFELNHPDAILIGPQTSGILVGDAIQIIANVHINFIEPLVAATNS
jgi:hypothetical protein